jgi:hypothetical protein
MKQTLEQEDIQFSLRFLTSIWIIFDTVKMQETK